MKTTAKHRKLVLDAIGRAWTQYPDMRLCQLLYNVLLRGNADDLFNIADKDVVWALADYMER